MGAGNAADFVRLTKPRMITNDARWLRFGSRCSRCRRPPANNGAPLAAGSWLTGAAWPIPRSPPVAPSRRPRDRLLCRQLQLRLRLRLRLLLGGQATAATNKTANVGAEPLFSQLCRSAPRPDLGTIAPSKGSSEGLHMQSATRSAETIDRWRATPAAEFLMLPPEMDRPTKRWFSPSPLDSLAAYTHPLIELGWPTRYR